MSNTDPRTRWLIRADMPSVLEIEQLCYPSPWDEDDFVQVLRQRNCIGQVVEINDEVCGFLLYELKLHSLRIINIAVHPSCQQRGLGAKLLSIVTRKLNFERRPVAEAFVWDANLQGHKFFARNGFRCTGVREAFFDDGSDAYHFAYDLLEWADEVSQQRQEARQ